MNTRANRQVESETRTATGRHAVVRDAARRKRRQGLYEVEARYGRETS